MKKGSEGSYSSIKKKISQTKPFRQDFQDEVISQPLLKPCHGRSQSCPYQLPYSYKRPLHNPQMPIFQSQQRTQFSQQFQNEQTKKKSIISHSSYSNKSVIIHHGLQQNPITSIVDIRSQVPQLSIRLLQGNKTSMHLQVRKFINEMQLQQMMESIQNKKKHLSIKKKSLINLMNHKVIKQQPEDSGFLSNNQVFPSQSVCNKDFFQFLSNINCSGMAFQQCKTLSSKGKKLILQLLQDNLLSKRIGSIYVLDQNKLISIKQGMTSKKLCQVSQAFRCLDNKLQTCDKNSLSQNYVVAVQFKK